MPVIFSKVTSKKIKIVVKEHKTNNREEKNGITNI